jgi:hypothetical protein
MSGFIALLLLGYFGSKHLGEFLNRHGYSQTEKALKMSEEEIERENEKTFIRGVIVIGVTIIAVFLFIRI